MATAAQLGIANPPLSWPDAVDWLWTAPNPWVLITALFSALGAVSAIVTFFQPKPYSEKQGKADRAHQNKSFAAAENKQKTRHEEDMVGHDKTQSDVAALKTQLQAISDQIAQTNPQQATSFAEATGKLAESEDILDIERAQEVAAGRSEQAADSLMDEVHTGKQRNAERARQAARIYAPFAPSKAKNAYEEAVALDPEDIWSWIELGRLKRAFDTLADARACFQSALQRVANERDRMVLHNEFGHVLMIEGYLAEVRSEYEAGLTITKRFAGQEPGNSEWQRDLSVSYERLGDVEVAAGDLGAARERFEASLTIRERLAGQEPGNSQWQRDLSVSYNKLGDVEVAAGDLGAARERFEAGLAIAERLAGQEPGNSEWQRDVFISNAKLAQLAQASSDVPLAQERFGKAEAIMLALTEQWPDHPAFANDLEMVRRDIARLNTN